MGTSRIQQIEAYVRQTMAGVAGSVLEIGHDFKHVDRVRRWALAIAREEGYVDRELVEAAALLHDVGRARVEQERQHAQVGAEMAERFLRAQALFSEPERAAIVDAVQNHNALGDLAPLATLVRDADILDMLGAVGVMRALTSKHALPEYDLQNVKGETWGITARDVDRRFAAGVGIGMPYPTRYRPMASLPWSPHVRVAFPMTLHSGSPALTSSTLSPAVAGQRTMSKSNAVTERSTIMRLSATSTIRLSSYSRFWTMRF
jgi:putative nucleotidyltransferase with HDIG domain